MIRSAIELSIEHRAAPAPAPAPLSLALVDADGPVRLEARDVPAERSLTERIAERLLISGPQKHRELRRALGVRDEHLTAALRELEAAGRVARTNDGWIARNGT